MTWLRKTALIAGALYVLSFVSIPIAVWEFSLGVYLIVKGFKSSPITAAMVTAGTRPADRQVVAV
jgi:hypothetical protein